MNVHLDRRITIEQPVAAQDATYGASTPTWSVFATVWAERYDAPPSRSESLAQGLEQARNLTRWRFRYLPNVKSTMRIRHGGEVFQIVGGPAQLGRQEWLEVMTETFSTGGGA